MRKVNRIKNLLNNYQRPIKRKRLLENCAMKRMRLHGIKRKLCILSRCFMKICIKKG